MFGDVMQAMRSQKDRGINLQDSLSVNFSPAEIIKLAKCNIGRDQTLPFQEERSMTLEKRRQLERKVEETLNATAKSAKANRLLLDSFHTISRNYEAASASKGAF